jgi:hypothetical protein
LSASMALKIRVPGSKFHVPRENRRN